MLWFGLKDEIKELKEEIAMLTELVGSIIDNMEPSKKPRKRRRSNLTNKSGSKKITPEEEQEFYRLYKQGLRIVDIANTTGRSNSTVSVHLRKVLREKGELND